jgi:hypothetical protein
MSRYRQPEDSESDESEGSPAGFRRPVCYETQICSRHTTIPGGHGQPTVLPVRPALQLSSTTSRHQAPSDRSVMAVNAVLNPYTQPGRHVTDAASMQNATVQPQYGSSRHGRPTQQLSLPSIPTSQSPGRARRESRPEYTEEEGIWVWYHRIDLSWSW